MLQLIEHSFPIDILFILDFGHHAIDTIGHNIMYLFRKVKLGFFDLILCFEFKPLLAALVPKCSTSYSQQE
ncbi:hypothetical protein D3C79_923270 [compost metagenome]